MRAIAGGRVESSSKGGAFAEGRRLQVLSLRHRVDAMLGSLLQEIEAGRASMAPEVVEDIESTFEGVDSPVASARVAGAESTVVVLRAELELLFEAELERIAQAHPVHGGGT